MATKKRIIAIAIYLTIIIAIVYFLPFPLRIDVTLQASRLVDGVAGNSATLSIKGWHLIYLFQPDKLKGTLTITPYDFESSNKAIYELMGTIFKTPDNDVQWCTLARYSAARNIYVFGTIFFSENFENVMIVEHDNVNSVYVASTKANYETDRILDYFKDHK